MLEFIGNFDKVTSIYNPCDVKQIQPLASPPFSIKDFGLTNKGYIIHVGSFDSMKGHQDLLQAHALPSIIR